MNPVITGKSKITSKDIKEAILKLNGQIRQIRFVHDLERLTVAGIGLLMDDAAIRLPVKSADISLYIGIDDSIEDIKDEYFNNILDEGILGASPLLFPFTSPNALTAQISIVFDIRGESIMMPIKYSYRDVIEYAIECITGEYTRMAIAGGILSEDKETAITENHYKAEFFFLENLESAVKRGAKIYENKNYEIL